MRSFPGLDKHVFFGTTCVKVVFLSFSLSLLLSFEWLYLKDRTGKECQETGREGRDDMQQKTTG